jgi:beta-glucosidase/6-phospho-beta-glucosidase/beta-galactosidase
MMNMATVKISTESLTLLIANAEDLEITVKDLLDSIIMSYYVETSEEEKEEEEDESKEESEEED